MFLKCENIQFVMRFIAYRPFSEEELRNNAPQVVTCNEYQREVAVSQSIAGKHIDRVFTFDKVFDRLELLFLPDLFNLTCRNLVKA